MSNIYSYEIAEGLNGQLNVYVNNILVAYVSDRRVAQIRNIRKFIYRVLTARDRRTEVIPTFTYRQLYR